MKYSFIYLAILALFIACGTPEPVESGSVEEALASDDVAILRAKKAEIDTKRQALDEDLKRLEERIKALDPQQKVPLITTFTTVEDEFKHYVELQGNVSTKKNIIIYPEYAGLLTDVRVREGQYVRKGQVLARVDDGGLTQQQAQLEIQLDLAKTTFERQERLWNQKIGSELAYLESKSNYEARQKAIDQLKKQIAKTVVTAPFSGTIDEVITEQGSVVGAGQSPLFRIVNLNDMYVEADVPESYISSIKPGKEVEVNFPILDLTLRSKVRQAGSFVNPANRTFNIQVDVKNKGRDIKPNLTARLKINDYTNKAAVLIPQSIISENAEGEQYVYIVSDLDGDRGRAKRVIIETGKSQDDVVEVINGLTGGMQIIDEGARSVLDSQEVRIMQIPE